MENFELDSRLERDTKWIGDFKLCRVLLMNESRYPWVILVPRLQGLKELYELPDPKEFYEESLFVSKTLMKHFKGDKMNVAALGNVVSQLHIHHVVRYENDEAWPDPVWGKFTPRLYDDPAVKVAEYRRILFP